MNGSEWLLREFHSGSELALRRFMDEHMKPLTFFATTLVTDQAVAEEIVADTFIKLYNGRTGFATPAAVKGFLYITTRNACYDYLKSATRKRGLNREELSEDISAPDPDTLTRIMYSELMQLLYAEIDKLPEQQAAIFRLSYLDDLSTEEIAAKLGITVNAVKLGRSRAKRTLRSVFGERKFLLLIALLNFF